MRFRSSTMICVIFAVTEFFVKFCTVACIVLVVSRLRADHDRDLLSLAMCWLLSQPVISSVIAGATSAAQVEANVAAAAAWRLSAAELAEVAERVTVLDHHITARDNYESDLSVVNRVEDLSHEIIFDMSNSGAVLSWNYFGAGAPVPGS